MHEFDPRSALEVPPEERLDQYERLWAEPGFKKWLSNFQDIMSPGEANEDYAEFVRNKIRERVKDPVVAENAGAQGPSLRLQRGYHARPATMMCTTRIMSCWLTYARPP